MLLQDESRASETSRQNARLDESDFLMITGLDHIQIAMPAGTEAEMVAFYCDLIGLSQIQKPEALAGRGGFWAVAGAMQIHFGVDPQFHAATKGHPAFRTSDLDALAQRLSDRGFAVKWDTDLPGVRRFFTNDPVGNRVELIAEG